MFYRWLMNIDGSPGLTHQAIDYLRNQRDSKEGWRYEICSVMIDSMHIMRKTFWDANQQRIVGYVDLGDAQDSTKEATEALVIMAVGIKSAWKKPIGYFFVNGILSQLQAQLIKMSLNALVEANVIPVSLTLDGCSTNLATIRSLGCVTKPVEKLQNYFPLETSPFKKVYVFLDVCHMLKILRNILGKYKDLKIEGEHISWSYIAALHDLQKKEGLRLGNKICDKHIAWQKQRMKVIPIIQTYGDI